MPLRHLFGPVTADFADRHLRRAREAGLCLTFDTRPGCDLALGPRETWESLSARFPAGWQPDLVALALSSRAVPPWLLGAPVPVVAFADDWGLLWHPRRRL